ncbi:MAG: phosphoribosylaminoimidazolesuccinocarboxamide synthase [Myxococcaceae bacterium]
MDTSLLLKQLPFTLKETSFPELGEKYQGKVRDTYRQGDRLTLITTDRLSAFDRVLTTIPFKGEILNRLATFWFEKTKHVATNHVIDVPDPSVVVGRRCEPLPIEFVVRGYITGSLWRDYQKGTHTAYGLPFPTGLEKDQKFDRPLITPSTKAALGAHDEPISEAEISSRGLVSKRDWDRAKELALGLFAEGVKWCATRGLILVDTKYEFGKSGDEIVLVDEIHTPDSSRFWMADEYAARFERGDEQKMLDKENIRQWLIKERNFQGHGEPPVIPDDVRVDLARIYASAFEQITGQTLRLNVGDVRARIERSLRANRYL